LVVTGSALEFDAGSQTESTLPFSDLLPFPVAAVEGHQHVARVIWPLEDRPVLLFQGRLHCYQGFDAHQVVFGIRLGALLGAEVLILTNAAGSLRPNVAPGSLCPLSDHLNLSGQNPLQGELPAQWGERFPSMNDAYDLGLRQRAAAIADDLGIELQEGVYAWLLGPTYETPAEIRMLRGLGADLVGMSTVPEVIAARQMGVRCFALSLVTNLAAGMTEAAPSHNEVIEEGRQASARLCDLLMGLLTDRELFAS
jgi:purine-nucleoside phosphorylase